MHSSVQGMSQKFKKIKNPKVNEKFFNVQSKKFNIKPQYQNVGDKDIISPTAYQPVKNSPAKTSSKLIEVKAEEMPREAWKTEKDQKLEPSKKQNAKGFSPNKVSQRNYSTVKGAPFKKEFGLLDAKKAEAEALQKLRYETNEPQIYSKVYW